MVRRPKHPFLSIVILLMTSVGTVGAPVAEVTEPDLLQGSQALATFSGSEVKWAACMPSGDSALLLKTTDKGFTLAERNLLTGIDTPLNALQKLCGPTIGYNYTLSPDGTQLLWMNRQSEVCWSTLDGQQHDHTGAAEQRSMNPLLWTADSKHWVEFAATGIFVYTHAEISDGSSTHRSRFLTIFPDSPLAHTEDGFPPISFDNALLTQNGRLLVNRISGSGVGLNVDIFSLDPEQHGLPLHQFTLHLPGGTRVSELAFSPDGEQVAWLLRHDKPFLCVSRLDGSRMHLIGTLTHRATDPNRPNNPWDAGPTALRWSSDGKSLTFLFRNTLYRTSAAAIAENAPMPSYLTVTKPVAPTDQDQIRMEALSLAVLKADAVSLKRLIAEGAPINFQDMRGDTPLMISAKHGYTEIVKILLSAGADPDLRSRSGDTALLEAIEKSQDATVLVLLANGVRVNQQGAYGRTALLVETAKGTPPGRMANPAMRARAPRQASMAVVSALLERGADVNLTDEYGETPLINAANAGALPIVQLLMSNGAQVNTRDDLGSTALYRAAVWGNVELGAFLLENGADPNVEEDAHKTNGETPLTRAAYKGDLDMCKLLLKYGAKVDQPAVGGRTPLAYAADQGNIEVARFLLENGANPNLPSMGAGMLINAVVAQRTEVIALLLQHGADINATGPYWNAGKFEQRTALECAHLQHLENMAAFLKKSGAKE